MEKLTKIVVNILVALVVLAIVGSFVALVITHIFALCNKEYYKSIASQETTFIASLTLGLAIVMIIPYIINNVQIKKEMENYWKSNYQKKVDKFISESGINYAHTSRMIAYLLMQKKHFYWAMSYAGDSAVSYIKHFKEHPEDLSQNKEYFTFSLNIIKMSFKCRREGSFLKDNFGLKFGENFKEFTANEIEQQIFKGEKITSEHQEIGIVKELKRAILRYIKWQCIIYSEIKEYDEKLSNGTINLIEENLGSTFENDTFEDMVRNVLKSFYDVDKKNVGKFINEIVKDVDIIEYKEKVRKYLEKMLKPKKEIPHEKHL